MSKLTLCSQLKYFGPVPIKVYYYQHKCNLMQTKAEKTDHVIFNQKFIFIE